MRQFQLEVTEITTTRGQLTVNCQGEGHCVPGQFYLAQTLPGSPTALRVPIFPFPGPRGHLTFSVNPAHALASLTPGDWLDFIGPCGRGFNLPAPTTHLLLVANDYARLPPLLHLALAQHHPVTLLLPLAAPLPDVPPAVEIQRGALTPDLAQWADLIALDLPDPEAWARLARALCPLPRPSDYIQALITPPMPCGVGACLACWVEVGDSKKLACVGGPVFCY